MKIDIENKTVTLDGWCTIGCVCEEIRKATGLTGRISDWIIRVEPVEKTVYIPIQPIPCCPNRRDEWPQFPGYPQYPQYPPVPIWVDPQPLTPLFHTICCHGAH